MVSLGAHQSPTPAGSKLHLYRLSKLEVFRLNHSLCLLAGLLEFLPWTQRWNPQQLALLALAKVYNWYHTHLTPLTTWAFVWRAQVCGVFPWLDKRSGPRWGELENRAWVYVQLPWEQGPAVPGDDIAVQLPIKIYSCNTLFFRYVLHSEIVPHLQLA